MSAEIPEHRKRAIDGMTVDQLLFDQRFAPVGDPRFRGAEGEYRMKRLADLRSQDPAAYVSASKSIGWGGAE
jgi:hypothetical protein